MHVTLADPESALDEPAPAAAPAPLFDLAEVAAGRFQTRTDPRFWNQIGPFGGWLAGVAMAAMRCGLAPYWQVRAVTVNYLGPLPEGELQVCVTNLRQQRTVLGLRAELSTAGELQPAVTAEAVFGLPREAPPGRGLACPALPDPGSLERFHGLDPLAAFVRAFDYRVAWGVPFEQSPQPESGGWLRLARPAAWAPEVLLMLADAWFPPGWASLRGPQPVSTLSMQVVFHDAGDSALPPPDAFVAARHRMEAVGGGYAHERGELWWPDGRLALQAQQLTWVDTRSARPL